MKKIMAWLLAAALLCGVLAGCGQKEEEVPAVPEETAAGALVGYDGETLTLSGGESFVLDAGTQLSLARGFVSGDTFTVTYQGEAVLSVRSERAADEKFSLRGTVKSMDGDVLKLEAEDGKDYTFAVSAAALDLWQGFEKGIFVEVSGLGDIAGPGACLWVQSVKDNDGAALLTAEPEEESAEEAAEPAEGEEAPAEEDPAAEEAPAEELPWELTEAEDTVWTSAAVNLRLGPGMEYARMGVVEAGEELARKGTTTDWSLVEVNGVQGYVQTAQLLTERPEKIYTIAYDACGGVGAPAVQYKIEGQDVYLSPAEPVRSGYTFDGWNTHESGFGIRLQPGDLFEMDDDIVLYAQWMEGEPAPTPAPTEEPAAEEGEEAAATPEPTPAPEPEPIADTCSAIAGVVESLKGDALVLDLEGETYEFDISTAALKAERGLHPGSAVTVYYAGSIGAGKDCSRAPAVCLEAEGGNARLEGEVAGLCANAAAIDLGGVLLFVEADTQGLAAGEEVTVTLKNQEPAGNLLTASKIE